MTENTPNEARQLVADLSLGAEARQAADNVRGATEKTKTDQATATVPSLALPYALYHMGVSHTASYAAAPVLLDLHRSLSQLGAADAARLGKMTVTELFDTIGNAIGGRTKL